MTQSFKDRTAMQGPYRGNIMTPSFKTVQLCRGLITGETYLAL